MIFTFGDGFATGHIWPEWPQILQALLPDQQVINTAGIGAGPEFLVSGLIDQLPKIKGHTVIFQWPVPDRFDKLLQDSSWNQIIDNDSKYFFNRIIDTVNRNWWLSSGSNSIKDYHNHWIQADQHWRRLEIYQILVKHTLENAGCDFYFTSTMDQDQFSYEPRFSASRQNQTQPSPIVHFHWLIDQILPNLHIQIDPKRLTWLEKKLYSIEWIAFDPEKDSIWENLIHEQ
jgi:hypothetical protein